MRAYVLRPCVCLGASICQPANHTPYLGSSRRVRACACVCVCVCVCVSDSELVCATFFPKYVVPGALGFAKKRAAALGDSRKLFRFTTGLAAQSFGRITDHMMVDSHDTRWGAIMRAAAATRRGHRNTTPADGSPHVTGPAGVGEHNIYLHHSF